MLFDFDAKLIDLSVKQMLRKKKTKIFDFDAKLIDLSVKQMLRKKKIHAI